MEPSDAIENICRMESDDNVGLSDIIDILNTLDNPAAGGAEFNGTAAVMAAPNAETASTSKKAPTIAAAATRSPKPPRAERTPPPPNPLHHSSSSPLLGQSQAMLQSLQEQPHNGHPSPPQSNAGQQQRSANTTATNNPAKPFIRIVEQPAAKALRFRYKCEGRSAGSIPGINSTTENKTFPTIDIVGYKGDVVIVVSCVTKDPPHRPHPHNLVGKDGCKDGICTLVLNGEPLRAVFSNLGIQCVKRNDIREALELREKMQVDPFKTKFSHKDQPSSIDLNAVRLCFQAFLKTPNGVKPLTPVVSEPVYDRKAMCDLMICRLCSCSAKVAGGDEIILLCEKIDKNDVKVRFFEINADGHEVWKDYADFHQTDIHKQTAIAFKTPRYHNTDIVERAKVFIQLERPSDGVTSEPLAFEYYPDPGTRTFNRIRRKLKRKEDLEIFQQILSLDSETTATKYSCPPTEMDVDNDEVDTVSSDSSASKPRSSDTINESDGAMAAAINRRQATISEADDVCDDDQQEGGAGGLPDMDIELEVPQIMFPAADESTQTSTPMEEILRDQKLAEIRPLTAIDKITEWMRSSEFERTDSLTVENGDAVTTTSAYSLSPVTVLTNITTLSPNNNTTISTGTDEERTFTDPLEQITEVDCLPDDGQSRRGTLDNPMLKDLPMGDATPPLAYDESELPAVLDDIGPTASTQASVDIDETFDDNTTYTSLQIAFKHPVSIPAAQRQAAEYANNTSKMVINENDGLVVLTNPPAPKIRVNSVQTPPSPPSPVLPIPPRSPSPTMHDFQQLPPLPPKRKTSQELNCVASVEHTPNSSMEHSRNGSLSSRPPSQIIIMRTPDQSPTKRQPTPTPSPKKKQSFFSRFFSRRKSKNESVAASAAAETASTGNRSGINKSPSPLGSREPIEVHYSTGDVHRSSVRSVRSFEANSTGVSPQNSLRGGMKLGKPVGRSASSASDQVKRKRLKTGGSPMNILKRELQKHEQLQNSQNVFKEILTTNANLWNAPYMPNIKTEPALSPLHYGAHRSPYQMSPSPQPLSPLNRNTLTPSPGLMRTPSAGSQTQMCELFNCAAVKTPPYVGGTSAGTAPSNGTTPTPPPTSGGNNHAYLNGNPFMNGFVGDENRYTPPTSGNGETSGNPFVVVAGSANADAHSKGARTSGGSITPLWPAEGNANGSGLPTFLSMTLQPIPISVMQQQQLQQPISFGDTGAATALLQNNMPEQQQPQQQPQSYNQLPSDITILAASSGIEDGPTLSGLLAFMDTDQLVHLNSDDLPLSNLSITT